MKIAIHWFRRDLRLEDNTALHYALNSGHPVLPLFIFDTDILKELPADDHRVQFIHETLESMHRELLKRDGRLLIRKGKPLEIWQDLLSTYNIDSVYINRDYEPYALERDNKVMDLLAENGIQLKTYKDQVIFEKGDIVKDDGRPYSVYTPYKRKWLFHFEESHARVLKTPDPGNFYHHDIAFPTLEELGHRHSKMKIRDYDLSNLRDYATQRDIPGTDATSYLGPHLRFGTIGVRQIISGLKSTDAVFLSELIWREFFMQILYHYPRVVHENFHKKYDGVKWRNDETEFKLWCQGKTGYPMVDAGMRQLNETGYMHNRVRMVTASFLCKHLLIDWRWGEAYFAQKLFDYELASNNGNWQWAAGTGCDAAPYFRVFNPSEQVKKFDKQLEYINKWVPELNSLDYPAPIVDHKFARQRAIDTYKMGLAPS